jgi:uncharacterized protein (TIGR03083 family)
MDPWEHIKTDRLAFADYLGSLTTKDWESPTWCDAWTVKGVTTHLLVTPTMSKGQVFRAFLASGFNLDKMSAKLVSRMSAAMSTDEIIAKTRSTAGVTSAPPGLKPMGVLGELLVHSGDIALALGKPFDLQVTHYAAGLDHFKDVQPVLGCKKRIAGLRLRATDAEWSTGDGPLVEGDARHLLAAMTGRRQALDNLTGDGVATLRSR